MAGFDPKFERSYSPAAIRTKKGECLSVSVSYAQRPGEWVVSYPAAYLILLLEALY